MSMSSRRGWSWALVLGFLAAGPATAADDPDLLKETKRRREVSAQRLEAMVREGLLDAARLQRTRPASAAELLRDLLRQIEEDISLPPERRAALGRRLRGSLRNLEDNGNRETGRGLEEVTRQAELTTRRVEDERRRAGAYRLSRQMQQLAELRRAGRLDEANRLSAELSARHPDNPAVTAARRTTAIGDRVADARNRRNESGERLLGVGREIEKSSAPPIEDMELPRDWREKSLRRSPGSKLTDKERATMKALETTIQADLTGTFSQAIDYLQTVLGQTIVLDAQAMKEVNVTSETPVNLKLRKATTRTVLKKLLAEHDLAYIIKDETIQVTTAARAREALTTRSYYVGDLASLSDVSFGPGLNQVQALGSIAIIMDMIQSQVDPQSWRINGGSGSITFEPFTMSLIVRQTAEVHMMMGGGR